MLLLCAFPPLAAGQPPPLTASISVERTEVRPGIGRLATFRLETNANDPVSDWDFGDGTPSMYQGHHPTAGHPYSASGTYKVTATVRDTDGHFITASTEVTFPAVAASITVASINILDNTRTVVFRLDANATVTNIVWSWGDGSQESASGHSLGISHLYKRAGEYTVTATVTDSNGRKVTATYQLIL